MPAVPPRGPREDLSQDRASGADEGDIRRGGWVLVLIGVVLVLVAVALVLLF